MADTVGPDPPPPPPPPKEVTVTLLPPGDGPPPRQGCFDTKSTLEKILIVLLIIIIIICLGFMATFLVIYFFTSPPEGICLSLECVNAAARLKSYMDESVDPCNNFYDYACGGWVKSQELGPHQHKIGVASIIGDANRLKIREILSRPRAAKDPPFKTQPKVFYDSCMNTDKLNERGSEPFLKLVSSIGKFPSLDPTWNESHFKLEDILIKQTKIAVMPLFMVDVTRDLKAKEYRVYISDTSLGLGSASKYKNGRNDVTLKKYEKWLVDNLVLLGVNRQNAEQDMKDVVDLEIRIAKLMRNDNEKGDISMRYNPMTIAVLQSKNPWLNWIEYFQGVASDPVSGGVLIPVEETVINLEPLYLEKLGTVLGNTTKRVLANYLMSRLIHFTSTLSSDFVSLTDQFNKETQGTDPKPRWQRCATEATSLFPDSVSRMYVDEVFSKSAKSYMTDMINDLTLSFSEILMENTWMTDETKKKAEAKLNLMNAKVGYPEYILDDDRLNRLYQMIPTNENEYLESFVASASYYVMERIKQLRAPKDKSRWPVHAAVVNAQYDVLENEIIFPAAFLQVPIFSPDYTSSMNYGAVGMVIGHEITHGFDNTGHQYDGNGVLEDWWLEDDKQNFKSRAECFVDQYGCYKWDGYSIDGKRTLGENIADNGGVKQSFRAYRNLIKRRGSEEPRLPGLKLNHNQVFFLSFAQVWCSKYRDEFKKELVETDPHTPSPFRVYGTLQNTQEFADAFQCPLGSRMNPMKKCVLW